MASGSNTVQSALKKSLPEKNRDQCKLIMSSIRDNFELQLAVLSTIEQYNNAKLHTQASSLTKAITDDKKAKKTAKKANAETERDWSRIIPSTLRRGLVYYNKWGPELMDEMLKYIEPQFRPFSLKEDAVYKNNLKEIAEFSLDIRMSEPPDRVADVDKVVLFPRLLDAYKRNGSRGLKLLDHIREGHLYWHDHGFYEVSKSGQGDATEIVVKNRVTGKTTTIPKAMVGSDRDAITQQQIRKNQSQTAAYVQTDEDIYCLGNFFPALGRTLKRRNSKEEAIVQASPSKNIKLKAGLRGLVVQKGASASADGADDPPFHSPAEPPARAIASASGNAARRLDLGAPPVEETSS